jgi:hypothetical protein
MSKVTKRLRINKRINGYRRDRHQLFSKSRPELTRKERINIAALRVKIKLTRVIMSETDTYTLSIVGMLGDWEIAIVLVPKIYIFPFWVVHMRQLRLALTCELTLLLDLLPNAFSWAQIQHPFRWAWRHGEINVPSPLKFFVARSSSGQVIKTG